MGIMVLTTQQHEIKNMNYRIEVYKNENEQQIQELFIQNDITINDVIEKDTYFVLFVSGDSIIEKIGNSNLIESVTSE